MPTRVQAQAAVQDRCKATLAFEEITAAPASGATGASVEPVTAAIVHGLLGRGRNWRSWARQLAATAADMTHRYSSREEQSAVIHWCNEWRPQGQAARCCHH